MQCTFLPEILPALISFYNFFKQRHPKRTTIFKGKKNRKKKECKQNYIKKKEKEDYYPKQQPPFAASALGSWPGTIILVPLRDEDLT